MEKCPKCKKYHKGTFTCAIYPKWIPDEVLFGRGSAFYIDRVEMNKSGETVIYMKEVTEDGVKRSGGWIYSEERSQTCLLYTSPSPRYVP